ncbi:MAG: ABC transporter ATP-binding protein [Candidatus Sericytochromatia bacterium]
MNIAINVENLVKIYKVGFWAKKVRVLDGVSFNVEKGSTFGLLGPNGAGKTTTLKALVGLTSPTKGKVQVLGKSPKDIKNHKRVGYLPESPYIYNYLTGNEFLNFCGALHQMQGKALNSRIIEMLDLVGLDKSSANKQLKTYSKGMLQRIGIAQSLINDPELVFFDEPMSGLDPIGRHEVKEIMKLLKKQNKTVFFNTHILSDVEELCDNIAIMVKGKIVKQGTIEQILTQTDNLLNLRIKGLNTMGKTNVKRISLKLQKTENEDEIIAIFNDIDSVMKGMTIAKQSGGTIVSMNPSKSSLEQIFVQLVNENSAKVEVKKG